MINDLLIKKHFNEQILYCLTRTSNFYRCDKPCVVLALKCKRSEVIACFAFQSKYSNKKPNTAPLGGKQNGTVLRGARYWGIMRVLQYTKTRGKEWWHGIRGTRYSGLGGTRYSGGRYWVFKIYFTAIGYHLWGATFTQSHPADHLYKLNY